MKGVGMGLGEINLVQPIVGHWGLNEFPESVFVGKLRFRSAKWKQAYEGVVAQYRQDVPRNSMHLKVMRDGRFVIDHVDQDNPDHGRAIPHFFNDHPIGKFALKAMPWLALGVVVGLIANSSFKINPSNS